MNLLMRVLAAVLGIAGPAAAGSAQAQPIAAGDWAGWAYMDDGSDRPLRLRVAGTGDALSVRFDELVARQYDLPATLDVAKAPIVVVERRRPNGAILRLEGAVEGDRWAGTLVWAGAPGRFELARSGEPIARLPPETFADAAGWYVLPGERVLVVEKRAWGELTYADLATGRQGTLFPQDRDQFWTGPAQYVPTPVEARVRLARDPQGAVVGLSWTETGGAPVEGVRMALTEEEVRFTSHDVELVGTLLRATAASAKNSPASRATAVVLAGSNWKTREAARRDATALAALGTDTFFFDRRGNGGSGGNPVHSFQDDADDAVAAVEMLARRPDVDAHRIGITGRSQGGWLAPLAASQSAKIGFVVLFVAPAVSPAEQEATRRRHRMIDAGFDDTAVKMIGRMLELAEHYSATGEGWAEYAALRARAVAMQAPDDVLETAAPDDPDWAWGRLNWRYEPVPTLERVRQPLLAFFGGADRNVVPEINLPRMRAALAKAGNRDVTLRVVADANHALVAIPAAERDGPYHRLSGIGPQPWPEIARWIAAKTRGAAGSDRPR